MDRENFVISLIIRARDSTSNVLNNVNKNLGGFRNQIDRAKRDMRSFDDQTARTDRGLGRLGSRLDQVRGKINAIRGPTDSASRSMSKLGRDTDHAGTALQRFDRRIHQNRESIAKFDNELRGMRILVIASQLQALSSALVGLSSQLVAVAGSAAVAASALGGLAVAAAAQAAPAIGLLAASVARLKAVFDVVQQVQDAQKAQATQATSATNAQADSMDKLANAADGVRDAQQRVRDAHLGVAEATREARREQEDLIQAQRRAALTLEESEENLRLLRSRGETGFALRSAELDVAENRTGARRAGQDLRQFRTQGSQGLRDATRQLRDAQEALTRSRRGMLNAKRDIADGGAGTVAAARQLDYLQAQLTGAERRLVKSILRLKETWREVSRPITDTIVNSFTRGVDRAEKAIQRPSLINAFQKLADSAAGQFDRITGFLTNDRSVAFFERSTRRMAENLRPITTAAIRISRAFMNIADAAAPVLHRLLVDFAQFAGRIENFTKDDRRLTEIFEFGERHLRVWLRLIGAITRLFVALIAPGGNAGFGAAESGLRTVNFLIGEIEDAIKWINDNPTKIGEHFADSEEIFKRIWQLLKEIAAIMLELFDPESVDTFADAIELMLPAFQQAAETFGWITEKIVAFLTIPGVKQLFTSAFGLAVFLRLGGRFRAVFTGLIADITGFFLWLRRSELRIATMATTTGGLATRWNAATAAVRVYTGAVEAAAVATAAAAGTAGARGGARGGNVFVGAPGKYNPRTGRFHDPTTGRFLPTAAPGGGIAGGLGGAAGLGAAARILGGAKFIGGIAAFSAVLTALTTPGGPMEKFGAALETASFGLIKMPDKPSDVEVMRNRNRAAGRPDAFVFGGAREERGIRRAIRENDVEALRHYRRELRLTRDEMEHFGDEEGVAKVTKQIKALNTAIEEGVGIKNQHTFRQAQERIQELSTKGVASIKQLRDNMRITFTLIADGAEKGSDQWRTAMVSNTQAGVSSLIKAAQNGRIEWKDAMEEIARLTRRQMRLVRGHVKTLSGEARDALSENFRTARIRAERQLGSLETATGKSLATIKRLFATELASYGFTAPQIRSIIRARRDEDDLHSRGSKSFEGGSNIIDLGQAEGGYARRPMGGFIGAMGERGQDAIRTILGRGEAVLNWGQQRLVEPALNAAYGFGLDGLFKRTRGLHAGVKEVGYAGGGRIPIVPVPGFPGEMANRAILDEIAFVTKRFGLRLTDAYGQGHQSPGHTVYGTAGDFSGPDRSMNAAVKYLARRYKVLYDGRFGSTAWPGHGPSTVAGSNAHLHVEFGTKDLGAATGNAQPFRIPRVEVVGAGPMGDVANAGIESVRRGAIRRARRAIERSLGAGVEGAELGHGAAPPGQLRSWLRRALSITHLLTPGNLNALYGRAMQESGGDPRAINNWDSNARAGNNSRGLLQTIPSTFAAYSLPGMKNIYNPIHNAVAAIRYMMATYGHIVGPSSTGYAAGGQIGGWDGQPRSVLAHAGEWILNKGQQAKAAAMSGLSRAGLKGALGIRSGGSSFKEGGEVDRGFDLPALLPTTVGGTQALIGRLFRFIKKFGNVNENLDILTRENGLFDQLTTQMEEATTKMENAIVRGTFKIKNNRVVRRHSEIWVAQETLDALETTGRQLQRTDRGIARGLRLINARIRALRQDGLTDRERDIVDSLQVQRRNLTGRRGANRDEIGANRQARFEAQEALKELLLTRFTDNIGKSDRRFELSRGFIDFQERMLAATGIIGIGRRSSIFEQRGANIQSQIGALTGFRDTAAARGFTDVVNDLNQRILDLTVEMAENTRALFQARVEEVNRTQQIAASASSARSRIAELQGELGIISPEEARKRMREQAQVALDALVTQGSSLAVLLNEARGRGDEEAIIELEQAVLDNTVAQLEGTVQLKELTGTLTGTQSFSSTAWQWFRTAIFTGSGGLLPQFQMPVGGQTVNGPQVQLPANGNGNAGGGGGGDARPVNIEITQNEQVDPVWLGNKVAWDINTPTT